jgi:DNA invertase Pin-like site-specific DNA recombinase
MKRMKFIAPPYFGHFVRSMSVELIDTTFVLGELVFNMFRTLVQFEPRMIEERTTAGLRQA